MENSYWENYYGKMSLDQIPWQRTQADWFKHFIDSGKIKGLEALDLGCGTGKKSIYLAKSGSPKVVGIDISPSAIKYANQNAKEDKVKNKTDFLTHDILDLSFLGNKKFDFILDWAVLHCIPRDQHARYLNQILEHSKPSSLFMLRVFSSKDRDKLYFTDEINGATSRVCVFQKEEIEKLFGDDFEILDFKESLPRRVDNLIFIEFLMRRK